MSALFPSSSLCPSGLREQIFHIQHSRYSPCQPIKSSLTHLCSFHCQLLINLLFIVLFKSKLIMTHKALTKVPLKRTYKGVRCVASFFLMEQPVHRDFTASVSAGQVDTWFVSIHQRTLTRCCCKADTRLCYTLHPSSMRRGGGHGPSDSLPVINIFEWQHYKISNKKRSGYNPQQPSFHSRYLSDDLTGV